MVDYEYVASGGFSFSGCATAKKAECYAYKYAVNSIVYICNKASLEGKLEKVCIKEVLINTNYYEQKVPLYVDKTNRCWLEFELCPQSQALELAIAYKTRQIYLIDAHLKKTCG